MQIPGILALQEVQLLRQLQAAHADDTHLQQCLSGHLNTFIKDAVTFVLLPQLAEQLGCSADVHSKVWHDIRHFKV